MGSRIPIDGTIELTLRCNLRCAHCYCSRDSTPKEMDTQEICRVLNDTADAGCLWLLITGGEPLIRPDFIEIYTHAKNKGMLITLFTNGTLLTPAIADHLKKYRPFSVEITLYGATRRTYEAVTGVNGSFERCMNGIRFLLERDLPLKLKAMVTRLNKHELSGMKRYADGLGLEFRFDSVISPGLDGSRDPCELRISPEETVELDLADNKRRDGWRDFCEKFWNPAYSAELFTCGAGLNGFHIDPYGRLRICEMVRHISYDLHSGSFKEGWSEFIPRLRLQKRTRDNKCKDCDVIPMCDQCPGWGLLEHGDPEIPVDYLCRIAHLRAEAFGMIGEKLKNGGRSNGSKETVSTA